MTSKLMTSLSLVVLGILTWNLEAMASGQLEPVPEDTCRPCACTNQTMLCDQTRYVPVPVKNVTDVVLVRLTILQASEVLGNLTNTTLMSLTITQCVFSVNINFLTALQYLDTVIIERSELTSDQVTDLIAGNAGYSQLSRLSLKSPLNPLSVPDLELLFCPSLQYLSLVNVAMTSFSFRELSKMSTAAHNLCELDLSQNDIDALPDFALEGLSMLINLDLSHNRIADISEFSFASKRLERLNLRDNGYDFSKCCDGIFSHSPNLQHLDISGNNFVRLSLDSLSLLFSENLTMLETLSIENSAVLHVPRDMFRNLPKLKFLDLSENEIIRLPADVFSRMPSLQFVNISGNAISVVDKTSFPVASVTMDLSSNPFSCTCDLLWFRRAVPSIKNKLLGFPQGYLCATPSSLAGEPLTAMSVDTGGCEDSSSGTPYTVTVACAIAGSMLLAVLLVVLGYVFRDTVLRKLRQSRQLMPYYRMRPSESG